MDAIIFGSQDSPFTEPLMSSLIVVNVREHICLQFINRADNVAKVVWELDKSCVWVWRCLSITQHQELFKSVAADASPVK